MSYRVPTVFYPSSLFQVISERTVKNRECELDNHWHWRSVTRQHRRRLAASVAPEEGPVAAAMDLIP